MSQLKYMTGFGNHFSTESVEGALPEGQNSPQKVPFGLYAEQLSGTAFTAPRNENQRSWLYRIRPSVGHAPFELSMDSHDNHDSLTPPNRMRWSARAMPEEQVDFFASVQPMMSNGSPESMSGVEIFTYAANAVLPGRYFFNADGEMLIIPESGRISLFTEMGRIELEPLEIAVIPRGVRFRVELPDGQARGYITENRGAHFRLPDLGPIGSNGLANSRDFKTPVAWAEDVEGDFELVQKYGGNLWTTRIDHSPLDVIAWHGKLAPYKYDLRRFNTMNTVSFDHPDPSIFTVLTSPTAVPGTANADFVIFPPRWMVAENTFRPPWFHRNVMSEVMGLIHGAYDAKADGFEPGGLSLHNLMGAHGPDQASWQAATEAELKPHKIDGTMAVMVESNLPYQATKHALDIAQKGYDAVWEGFPKAELP